MNTWNVVVRQDRNTYGGGVIIAVLRKFIATPVIIEYNNKDSNPELYWIKLHSIRKLKSIYICGFYRSQMDTRSSDTISCLRESLQKLPGKKGQQHIIIVGDANLHVNWVTNQPHSNSSTKQLDKQMVSIWVKICRTGKKCSECH